MGIAVTLMNARIHMNLARQHRRVYVLMALMAFQCKTIQACLCVCDMRRVKLLQHPPPKKYYVKISKKSLQWEGVSQHPGAASGGWPGGLAPLPLCFFFVCLSAQSRTVMMIIPLPHYGKYFATKRKK